MGKPEVGSVGCPRYIWKSRRVVVPHDFYLPADATPTVNHYCDGPQQTTGDSHSPVGDGLLTRRQGGTDTILKRCHPGIHHIFKEELGFHTFTAIQFAVIPLLLENPGMPSSDIIFTAATGQGKTLCYVIPIMTQLYNRVVPEINALVLAPTRELVSQIAEVFSLFCQPWQAEKMRSTMVVPPARVAVLGGSTTSFAAEAAELHGTKRTSELPQVEDLCLPRMQPDAFWMSPPAPADIVVATPGRFVEHLCATGGSKTAAALRSVEDGRAFCFEHTLDIWSSLRWIVLDEADRLLDQKYQNWPVELSRLSRYCAVPPQKVIASATMTTNPEKVSVLELERPLVISLSVAEDSYAIPPDLKHHWIGCPPLTLSSQKLAVGGYKVRSKPLVLLAFLESVYDVALAQRPKTLIFSSTKERALRLAALINLHFNEERHEAGGAPQDACHAPCRLGAQVFTASMSQNDRGKAIRQFEKRHMSSSNGAPPLDVLVCSDVLARGLDIPGLDYVVNYDPPTHLKTYIHRAGRTGRAGKAGTTVTLLTRQELPRFRRLMKANRLPPSGTLREWSKHQESEGALETTTNEGCVGTTLWDIVFRERVKWSRIMQWVQKKQGEEASGKIVFGSPKAITLEEKEWSGDSDDDNIVDGNGELSEDKGGDHDNDGAAEAEMEDVAVEVLNSEEHALEGSSYFELLLRDLRQKNV